VSLCLAGFACNGEAEERSEAGAQAGPGEAGDGVPRFATTTTAWSAAWTGRTKSGRRRAVSVWRNSARPSIPSATPLMCTATGSTSVSASMEERKRKALLAEGRRSIV
jgi:hypothetical protein